MKLTLKFKNYSLDNNTIFDTLIKTENFIEASIQNFSLENEIKNLTFKEWKFSSAFLNIFLNYIYTFNRSRLIFPNTNS